MNAPRPRSSNDRSLLGALQARISKNARLQPTNKLLQRSSSDPGRAALGDDLDAMLQAPYVGLTGSMYATRTLTFPFALTEDPDDPVGRINTNFGQEINYFSMQIVTSRTEETNNLISTSTVRGPFLVRAIAFVMFLEFEQSAITGMKVTAPADSGTDQPVFTGALTTGVTDNRPASFQMGWSTQEFAWAFSRAYRLQMWLGGDLRYVDELLGHVGSVEKGTTWCGYGNAQRPIMDYIESGNQQLLDLGSTDQFLPVNAALDAEDATEGVMPPLADTAVGSGLFGGMYQQVLPIRPFVALPGIPIDIQLVRENNEDIYYQRMVKALLHRGMVTPSSRWSDVLDGITPAAYAGDYQFKFGNAQIGFILLGARISSRCCVEFYYRAAFGIDKIYTTNGVTLREMEKYAREMGLDGLPFPQDPNKGRPMLKGLKEYPHHGKPHQERVQQLQGLLNRPPTPADIGSDRADWYKAQGAAVQNPERFENALIKSDGKPWSGHESSQWGLV